MPDFPTGQFVTRSAEETFVLAYGIGETLHHSTVFLLQGELGAGKTVFAKGIAAGLDIDPAEVNSPTFTLVNAHEGRMKLYHLDLYRIESAAEVYGLGLEELLSEPDAIVLIEWPERLGSFAVSAGYHVRIDDGGGNARQISISALGMAACEIP
jgi:tRNA threonylcarbamoyladenosine biosynthesis protein TsaE